MYVAGVLLFTGVFGMAFTGVFGPKSGAGFFHQDLLVLHVIKYYAVDMTDIRRKKHTIWHSTPEVSEPLLLTMSACSLVITNSHVDACQAEHFQLNLLGQ